MHDNYGKANICYDALSHRAQVISRAGTGTNISSSNPISFTFVFAPSVVLFLGYGQSSSKSTNGALHLFCICNATYLTTSFNTTYGFGAQYQGNNYMKKSSDGKTIYYYNSNDTSAYNNFNSSGSDYLFAGLS